jgi:hypothetical protein
MGFRQKSELKKINTNKMKKYCILLVLALFSGSIVAQKISGGITFSPLVSWMKPDSKKVEFEASKFGFSFGLVGDYNFSDNFSFSTGINVYNGGGKLKYKDSIPAFEADSIYNLAPNAVILYKLQYIEIPLSFKGKTNEIGYITYFLKGGLSPMFRYKAKGDVSQYNISGEDFKGEVSGFNLGFHLGGGIEYSLGGNTKVLAELQFTNGLTDVTKDDYKTIFNMIILRTGIIF